MDLDALLHRTPVVPFAPGTRIPWDEPGFSARMLREHLSQHHDRASRRFEVIDRQVAWLHHAVLGGEPGRILDLGCGPGLYTSRLARLGHQCVGLDFSPASIAHARSEAAAEGLDCRYEQVDLCTAALPEGFDAAMMLFGELNTLPPMEAESLLVRVRGALVETGRLVLELHYEDYVRALGEATPGWSAQQSGLFCDAPHLTLHESEWHPDERATTERYFVFTGDGPPNVYANTTKAYADDELDAMFERAGLVEIGRYESLTGDAESAESAADESDEELFGLVLEPSSSGAR